MIVRNGGQAAQCYYAHIGHHSSSNGTVTITGSGSTWTIGQDLYIGDYGTGSLTISDGAIAEGGGVIGENSGGNGTAVVDGSGSQWDVKNPLKVGPGGRGSLTIQSRGTVSSYGGFIFSTRLGRAGLCHIFGRTKPISCIIFHTVFLLIIISLRLNNAQVRR